jgi:hypothetical protein
MLGSALLLGGCGGMVADSTIVDGLRVLNIASEPASPAPGEVLVLDALVADPAGEGFDSWVWWCVEASDGPVCGDGALPADVPDTTQGGFLTLSAAACVPGRCADGPEREDPDAWLAEQGFDGVTYARRTVGISPSPEARLNDNPAILPVVLPEVVTAGEVAEISFQIDDALVDEPEAYGFASAGGFLQESVPLNEEGVFRLELSAPEEAGPVTIWVAVDDGLGGTASFVGSVSVSE